MISKKVSPKGRSVRVTFTLPADTVEDTAAVVGNFNDWDPSEGTMKYNAKKGVWTKSLSFKPGETVEFRYVVDENTWLNDADADGVVETPYFSENSILEL